LRLLDCCSCRTAAAQQRVACGCVYERAEQVMAEIPAPRPARELVDDDGTGRDTGVVAEERRAERDRVEHHARLLQACPGGQ
jgi:hypothetical protein